MQLFLIAQKCITTGISRHVIHTLQRPSLTRDWFWDLSHTGWTSRQKAISTALHNGYRNIDTATLYGNESGIGEGLNLLTSRG